MLFSSVEKEGYGGNVAPLSNTVLYHLKKKGRAWAMYWKARVSLRKGDQASTKLNLAGACPDTWHSLRCWSITVRYKTVRYTTVHFRTVRYAKVHWEVCYKTAQRYKTVQLQNGILSQNRICFNLQHCMSQIVQLQNCTFKTVQSHSGK